MYTQIYMLITGLKFNYIVEYGVFSTIMAKFKSNLGWFNYVAEYRVFSTTRAKFNSYIKVEALYLFVVIKPC